MTSGTSSFSERQTSSQYTPQPPQPPQSQRHQQPPPQQYTPQRTYPEPPPQSPRQQSPRQQSPRQSPRREGGQSKYHNINQRGDLHNSSLNSRPFRESPVESASTKNKGMNDMQPPPPRPPRIPLTPQPNWNNSSTIDNTVNNDHSVGSNRGDSNGGGSGSGGGGSGGGGSNGGSGGGRASNSVNNNVSSVNNRTMTDISLFGLSDNTDIHYDQFQDKDIVCEDFMNDDPTSEIADNSYTADNSYIGGDISYDDQSEQNRYNEVVTYEREEYEEDEDDFSSAPLRKLIENIANFNLNSTSQVEMDNSQVEELNISSSIHDRNNRNDGDDSDDIGGGEGREGGKRVRREGEEIEKRGGGEGERGGKEGKRCEVEQELGQEADEVSMNISSLTLVQNTRLPSLHFDFDDSQLAIRTKVKDGDNEDGDVGDVGVLGDVEGVEVDVEDVDTVDDFLKYVNDFELNVNKLTTSMEKK